MKSLFYLLLFLFINTSLLAQSDIKIGLALSGGGARGMAHIGVIRALEEEGITPDYITGVSMGSIVGCLYAMGYSADDIEIIFREIDWDLNISDDISEKNVIFDEKKLFRTQLLSLSYDKRHIGAPSGLVFGQQISATINYYTFPVANIHNFDSLKIPFRVVATDIENFEAVVLKSGNLADAVHASMAVPTAFSPVEINNRLLVDGGVVHNFPVSDVKEMGANFVIGSYTGRSLYTKKELTSIKNVAAQIMSFNGLIDSEKEKKNADILIEHDFGTIKPTDFKMIDTLIAIGYNSTKKHIAELRKLQNTNPKDSKYIVKPQKYAINNIEIVGNKIITDYQIKKQLKINTGDSISRKIIKKRMDRLYGIFAFNKIDYKITNNSDGNTLTIRCQEKSKSNFNTSLHYSRALSFGINLSYISRGFIFKKSKLTLETYISEYFRAKGDYAIYFGKNDLFNLRIGSNFTKEFRPASILDSMPANYNNITTNAYTGVNFQPGYGSNIGVNISYDGTRLLPQNSLNHDLNYFYYDDYCLNFTYELNTLDHYYMPQSGSEIRIQFSEISPSFMKYSISDSSTEFIDENYSNDDYQQLTFRSRYFVTIKDKITLGARANLVLTNSDYNSNTRYALIGGSQIINERTLTFIGFKTNQFVTKTAIGLGASALYNIKHKWQIGAHFDSYIIEENTLDTRNDELTPVNLYWGIGVDGAYKSRLGPIKLGVANGFSLDDNYGLVVNFSVGFVI